MKRNFYFGMALLAAATLSLSSCGAGKQATMADLAGEWDVVALEGDDLKGDELPYMGFNTTEGRVYGYAGCNRLTGILDKTNAAGAISFDNMASTRMMCADMATEDRMLSVLRDVKAYRFGDKGSIFFADGAGRVVAQLRKRCGEMKADALQGEWKIVSAGGFPAEGSTETQPTIWFDTEEKLTHGNAGCNTFDGSYSLGKGQSLKFSQMSVTMRMCADMAFEQRLLAAFDDVAAFGALRGGKAGLFDSAGQLLIVLAR